MQDCPFCLQNGLLESKVISRDEWCYMVEYSGPVLRDAVMIIPTRHVEAPFELSDDEWRSTQALLNDAKRFLDRQRPGGYSIGWNVHGVGGQTIPHAHMHVIARFADEPLTGQGIRHALKQETNLRKSLRV